jgi:hypothetical protein
MTGGADGFADPFDVVVHARGRVDLRNENRPDLVRLVLSEPRLDFAGAYRAAPVALEDLDVGAHQFRRMAPADREAAALQHQHLVAARQHVGERAFPGAVAVGDVDVGFVLGDEQIGEVAMQPVREIDHLLRIDVERRAMHRLQHFVGHVGGAGEGQDFTARANGHCCLSLRF